MSGKLTKRVIDGARPGETIWDGELRGFGLRVSPGGTRSYVLKYRARGKQRWITLGQHGQPMPVELQAKRGAVWTPSAARDEALRLMGRVRDGADPALEKKTAREAETLAQFSERYIAEHAEVRNKPKSVKEAKRNLKLHILPVLGNMKLREITREDVARFHRSKQGTPYLANRCLALISHMLSTAERWGVCPHGSTVCRHVDKFKEKARKRYLSTDEVKALGEALIDAELEGYNSYGLSIIRLLMFTGARRSEIEALRWDEVDLERRAIHLQDSKTGQRSIPLAAPALEILSTEKRIEGSPWVFPAMRGDGHYQGLGKLWRAVRDKAALSDVRLHDLRHTFASFGAAGGHSLPIIGALLGHKQSATTERYAHLANDPLHQAVDRISGTIAAALDGTSARIVALK
ncbi:site-specific integrase [Hyphobacterium sp. HN65]|uniref:Site-specific integrase n=1 Tax=Hyphobacterium lacteum TaxID=3116575 RepID=A0ABU7LQP5_9PROT|nr:site-specific integrase [Hyphobacterium sp. HN65]MEE2526236.1 site-specific integrase [Hyphobacterium sp. HN65]